VAAAQQLPKPHWSRFCFEGVAGEQTLVAGNARSAWMRTRPEATRAWSVTNNVARAHRSANDATFCTDQAERRTHPRIRAECDVCTRRRTRFIRQPQ